MYISVHESARHKPWTADNKNNYKDIRFNQKLKSFATKKKKKNDN